MTKCYDPKTYLKQCDFLKQGTIVDHYMIERELAHGGFSSVYLARHMFTQEKVAIKEYLPRKLAHRTRDNVIISTSEKTNSLYLKGRAHFFKEAKVLSKLKHPNIVDVINFFHANGTVYMVMTYSPGITLDKAIKNKKTKITEKQLVKVFDLLLVGIRKMHKKKVLHLDIKPGNILIRAHNNPLLLDFGAIQKYTASPKRNRSAIITHGFSPIEQYSKNRQLGPWTDIYAVGASMYFCLSGQRPARASKRESNEAFVSAVKAFKRKYPSYLLQAIDWAMEIEPENRPQTIAEFQQALA